MNKKIHVKSIGDSATLIAKVAPEGATDNVYTMNGVVVKKGRDREELNQLVPGVYILRSGNTVVKTIVR